MDVTIGFALVVLGFLQIVSLFYLWRTNRRLDTVTNELREEMEVTGRRIDEMHLAVREQVEDLEEQLHAANRRLDDTIEATLMIEVMSDRSACARAPGGKSRRLRRSDHRQ